ncbi:MAG: exopolysaccharide biosynthesis protein [Chitinophagaceae bacterium]|nr:exopolysaccharide biosynthesis protein [Chitinophagaceae bacterium]
MILVLLGTFRIEFPRPLIEIEKLCREGKLSEEIIVQSGHTKYESPFFTIVPFMDVDKLNELYDKARIIITHAGTGSMLNGVKRGKTVIAIPRLKKNGEHIDDHQLEIAAVFAEKKYVLPWYEDDSLNSILQKTNDFVPEKYVSKKEVIIDYLKNYIDNI